MADKQATLSIVLRTVDKATAGINAINRRLDAVTKPFRDFKEALGELREKSGLNDVVAGFKGVGGAITDILGKLLVVGGVIGAAVAGMFKLVDGFDALGDKAEAIGVSADFLAQMRYAAERSGASIESLDSGLQGFSKSLGQARAGTGRMAGFLKKASPALLAQLKAAKSNEQAFDLLAGAMAKLEDPAKKAALAQATLGDAALAPLFAKGPKGLQELRDRYAELAGPQGDAAAKAGEVDDAMKDLKASTDGIKAALVSGLAPALKVIVERLREWFTENRENIREWAASLGERLPAAVSKLVSIFHSIVDTVRPFVDSATKLKIIAVGLAAVLAGPLLSAIATLGVALLTTPVGWIVAGIAAIAAGATLLVKNWETVKGFFVDLWDGIVGAFRKAWEVISGIVDKIVGAVETITSAVTGSGFMGELVDKAQGGPDWVQQSIGAAQGGDWRQQAIRAARMGTSSSETRVKVDFANAPRGTRVKADPQSSADVDLSVGYQLNPGGS